MFFTHWRLQQGLIRWNGNIDLPPFICNTAFRKVCHSGEMLNARSALCRTLNVLKLVLVDHNQKFWVLGLYWLESLASLLQIYQVDSCDSCILTNQSGGFWLGRYVFRFCWGRVSIWTVYHPCSPRFFWLPLRHGQVVASSCQTAFALAVYKSPVLIHPTRNASVVR